MISPRQRNVAAQPVRRTPWPGWISGLMTLISLLACGGTATGDLPNLEPEQQAISGLPQPTPTRTPTPAFSG